jgi:hypothetical protein
MNFLAALRDSYFGILKGGIFMRNPWLNRGIRVDDLTPPFAKRRNWFMLPPIHDCCPCCFPSCDAR